MIKVQELRAKISKDDTGGVSNDPLIIDIRKKEEFDAGHIGMNKEQVGLTAEAVWIDNFGYMGKPHNLDKVQVLLDEHFKATGNKEIVIVCIGGVRAAMLTALYGMLGFDAKDLVGGNDAWLAAK